MTAPPIAALALPAPRQPLLAKDKLAEERVRLICPIGRKDAERKGEGKVEDAMLDMMTK